MLERLKRVEERYNEINDLMQSSDVITDIKKMTELSKEQRGLEETVNVYTEYKEIAASIEDLKEMAKANIEYVSVGREKVLRKK